MHFPLDLNYESNIVGGVDWIKNSDERNFHWKSPNRIVFILDDIGRPGDILEKITLMPVPFYSSFVKTIGKPSIPSIMDLVKF